MNDFINTINPSIADRGGYEYSDNNQIHDRKRLDELRALPLERKIAITQARIIEWYKYFEGKVYVSISGGKDSTVLYDIVHKIFPDVPAVFSDTGLEYPEIREFATNMADVIVKPSMSFLNVINKYGYPLFGKEIAEAIYYARQNGGVREAVFQRATLMGKKPCIPRKEIYARLQSEKGENFSINDLIQYMGSSEKTKSAYNKEKWLPAVYLPFKISHYCCNVMKKSPVAKYTTQTKNKAIIGTMTEESMMRKQAWLRHGCNAFDSKKQISQPLSFWTEQDILEYIDRYNLDICSVYGELQRLDDNSLRFSRLQRTGCVFCGFGSHLEKEGSYRFLLLKEINPKLYEYCMGGGQWIDNPDYDETLSDEPDEMGWVAWNPQKIWTPHKGLGMAYVFDCVNEIYGKDFIKYK